MYRNNLKSSFFKMVSGTVFVLFITAVQIAPVVNTITVESEIWEIPELNLNYLIDTLQKASLELDTLDTSAEESVSRNVTEKALSELVSYLNSQGNFMLHQAKRLIQIALTDKATFEILRAEYETELSSFSTIMDRLNKNPNEDLSKISDSFTPKLKQFQKHITDILDKIDVLKIQNLKVTIDVCVSYIRKGKYQLALSQFKKLNDDSHLVKIVSHAYDGHMDNLPYILKFIKLIDNCDQQSEAYQTLFDVIKTSNHLSHPKILHFSDVIEECMNVSLRNEIEQYNKRIIRDLVYDYKIEKMYEALEFDKHFPENEVSSRYVIYSALFEELTKNNHSNDPNVITLAYRVKALDDYCKMAKDDCKYTQEKLSNLKKQFSRGVKILLWSKYVTIESMRHKGYTLYGKSTGEVYTYPNNNSGTCGGKCNQKWTLRPLNEGRYFELENAEYDMKLYRSGSSLYAGAYRGFTGHWRVLPHGHGTYYLQSRDTAGVVVAHTLSGCSGSLSGSCGVVFLDSKTEAHNHQLWTFN